MQQFAVLGFSGGAPHALACGALLAERVLCVAGLASPAPFTADGLDWFAGMAPAGAASLRASAEDRQPGARRAGACSRRLGRAGRPSA